MTTKPRRQRIIELLDQGKSDTEILAILDTEYPPGTFKSANKQALGGTKWGLRNASSPDSEETPPALFTEAELQTEIATMVRTATAFVGRFLDIGSMTGIIRDDENFNDYAGDGLMHAVAEIPEVGRFSIEHIAIKHQMHHLYELCFANRFDLAGTSANWVNHVQFHALSAEHFYNAVVRMDESFVTASPWMTKPEKSNAESAHIEEESPAGLEYPNFKFVFVHAFARVKAETTGLLTFRELAYLAHLNERTIRNFASSPDAGLAVVKEGNSSFVVLEQSKHWTASRPQFKPIEVYDSYSVELAVVANAMRQEIAMRDITASTFVIERFGEDYLAPILALIQKGDASQILTGDDISITSDISMDVRNHYPDLLGREHFLWATRLRSLFG